MLQQKANGRVADVSEAAIQGSAGAIANAALSHHSSTTNSGGPIGPAAIVTWISPPFVSLFGKVLILGAAGAQENTADTEVAFVIVRDPPAATGAGGVQVGAAIESASSSAAPLAVAGSPSFIDTVVAGSSHTWGVQVQSAAGTVTIPTSGASITLIDLPG